MGGEARKTRRAIKAALTNPLIAERILNQAEFKEKQKLRLLNKFWRDSTLKEWRQSVPLPLHFDRDDYYFSWQEEREVLMVKSFEAIMEGRSGANVKIFRIHDVPFRRLILNGLKPRSGYPRIRLEETFEQVVLFLAKYGSTLEYLKLEWVRVSQLFFESLLKGIIRRFCPKLKELVVCDCLTCYPEDEDASTDYDSLLEAFCLSLQLFPEGQASKLTKLSIAISEEVNDSVELLQFWEKVFSSLPNLKVLKYRPGKSMVLFGIEYLITGASRLPLTNFPNGKYLELEELDLHFDLREESSPGYGEFSALGTFLEVAKPPLRKMRIALHFNCNEVRGMEYANEMSNFHQFCSIHGHRLTELKINILKRCFCNEDDFQWISFLTGHYFPNLTHLTIVCFKREHGYDTYDEDDGPCIPGKINFDFEALKGMPKLQVFHCFEERYDQYVVPQRKLIPAMVTLAENGVMPWREGQEINEVYENPLELKELREFLFHSSTDQFDEDSLRIALGWMKNLQKLTLYLNKDTLQIVFKTLPDLNRLTMLGMSFKEVTEAEFQFGTIWMDEMSRARQEKEWRHKQKRDKAKDELGEVEVLRREAEKEKRERRKAWLERRRMEMERQEREWIGNQGKEEGEWNYVSYRKSQTLPRLPPRQPHKSQSDPDLDNVFVISEILKWKNETNVFRTYYCSWEWPNYLQYEKAYQIQYKSGED